MRLGAAEYFIQKLPDGAGKLKLGKKEQRLSPPFSHPNPFSSLGHTQWLPGDQVDHVCLNAPRSQSSPVELPTESSLFGSLVRFHLYFFFLDCDCGFDCDIL